MTENSIEAQIVVIRSKVAWGSCRTGRIYLDIN